MTRLAPSLTSSQDPLKSHALERGEQAKPLRLTRHAWLAILIIGGLALFLRLATYDRHLPFIDYTDEAVYVALAQEIRGLSDETALREKYGALPPLYTYFNAVVQSGYDLIKPHNWTLISDYYYALRFLAVWMGVFTALGMAWLGWQIGGPVAGWIAGLVWATHPTIVELNSLAIPDPPLYLCFVLTMCAGVYAWKYDSKWALLLALIGGIIGIYLKYWVVTVTFPFIAAWLILFRRNSRGMLIWSLVYGIVGGIAAAYLVFGINPLESTNKLTEFSGGSLRERALDIQRLTNNFWHAVYPVGVLLYVSGLIGGAVAYFYNRSRKRKLIDTQIAVLLIVMSTVGFFLTTAISHIDLSAAGRMRHILPTMTAMFVLWGACIAQILYAFEDALAARRVFSGDNLALRLTALSLLGMVLLFTYFPANIDLMIRLGKDHIVNRVRDWADVAIPNDGLVLQPFLSDLDRTWNRTWGAYAGNNPLIYWSETQSQILESRPEDYAERNIDYVVISEYDLTSGEYSEPAIRQWLQQLYMLKIFPEGPEVVGSKTYFYKMLPPQVRPRINFGGIVVLDGYDVSATTLAPGDELRLRPYWGLAQIPPANYSMFVHLYPAETLDMKAQQDGALVDRERQTQQWTDTNEIYLGRETVLTLPADLPAGEYRLAIGVYDYITFQRLLLADGTDFYSIPITIEER